MLKNLNCNDRCVLPALLLHRGETDEVNGGKVTELAYLMVIAATMSNITHIHVSSTPKIYWQIPVLRWGILARILDDETATSPTEAGLASVQYNLRRHCLGHQAHLNQVVTIVSTV